MHSLTDYKIDKSTVLFPYSALIISINKANN
jgi:hypothetical protein